MTKTNPCYNPKTFVPSNKPLLSLSQWQMLQFYLVDAQNLDPTQLPYPDVQSIYSTLQVQASNFNRDVLPKAYGLGNKLQRYGQTASDSFNAVVSLMGQPQPDKTAILQLLGNLKTTAATYQTESDQVFTAISDYISETNADVTALQAAVQRETKKAGSDQTQIEALQLQYQSKYSDKQVAQAKITGDQKTIDDTKYYSWVPFVGTSVAVGEIIAKEQDIKTQLARIRADVAAMQQITQQIQALRADIAQLTYTANYNTHMATEVNNAMSGLTLIKGAWGTIVTELGDVITNINKATASALKDQECLSDVFLTTAANEWEQVGNDAQTFVNNFYVQPASSASNLG